MKIWLINPYGPIPTEDWRVYCYPLLAEELAAAGHEIIWWTSNFSHHFKRWRSDGWADLRINDMYNIRLVPTSGYKSNIGIGRILRDLIFSIKVYYRARAEPRPDLIIFTENPLTFGYAAHKLAIFHSCPLIYHQMDLWPELMVARVNKHFRLMAQLLLTPVYLSRKNIFSSLSAVTALATPYLQSVLNICPKLEHKPHAVIYNGIDVELFRSNMKIRENLPKSVPRKFPGDVWAIFAGSLGPSYDIDTLCEAARLLKDKHRNIKIIIAGDGPRKSDVIAASQNSNIHFVGQLSAQSLAALYDLCDIGLCAYSETSNVEMPDKFYDYTAAGLAILVSLHGEVKKLVITKQLGLFYKPSNVGDFIEKISSLSLDITSLNIIKQNSWKSGMIYDSKAQSRKIVSIVNMVSGNI